MRTRGFFYPPSSGNASSRRPARFRSSCVSVSVGTLACRQRAVREKKQRRRCHGPFSDYSACHSLRPEGAWGHCHTPPSLAPPLRDFDAALRCNLPPYFFFSRYLDPTPDVSYLAFCLKLPSCFFIIIMYCYYYSYSFFPASGILLLFRMHVAATAPATLGSFRVLPLLQSDARATFYLYFLFRFQFVFLFGRFYCRLPLTF